MLSPNKPTIAPQAAPGVRAAGFSGAHIAVMAIAFTILMSVPIWTHPLPPLSDYINHLARMKAIATLSDDPQLATFYDIHWQVIPNLTMDLIVPLLAHVLKIYLAGQVFVVAMFALIVSGTLALNRALIGRWSAMPLLVIPLLYNYVFLVGLMNYIFGLGVALWALAGWVAVRERIWPLRIILSTASVVVLFFCHLSALGVYGVGVLSFEILRLWERRAEPWPGRIVDFVASGMPFLAAAPLLYLSPTMDLVGKVWWDQRGKLDGLMYVVADYSDLVAFAVIALVAGGITWAVRHRVLRFHPLVFVLMVVGTAVYFALPRIMFDTYMTDQRVPLGIAFMLLACGDLELRRRLVRRAFVAVLIVLVSMRLMEIDYNWSQLSDSTSQFRSSVKRIAPGSKVFVAYADRTFGEDVRDLGLVHAACIAMIERSALVTTAFTVSGKQVMHVKPEFDDYVDRFDGTPPSIAQLLLATSRPVAGTPAFWMNWTKFDYLYILFTEDEAPNPDPSRLKLIADGDRFQLYKIVRPEFARATPP
ncbi:MAG TPA: hypothetical protein VEJ40_08585 [Pseudolabrys sp.]|nr:hypothetical protein [Pseudolabrys sp.]